MFNIWDIRIQIIQLCQKCLPQTCHQSILHADVATTEQFLGLNLHLHYLLLENHECLVFQVLVLENKVFMYADTGIFLTILLTFTINKTIKSNWYISQVFIYVFYLERTNMCTGGETLIHNLHWRSRKMMMLGNQSELL